MPGMGKRDDIEPTAAPGPQEHLTDETELWRRFTETRDPAIREELVRRNLEFAKRLARRYRGASESFDDLLQVASLALRQRRRPLRPRPRHPLQRLRLADDPRRAQTPLPRPRLDRAGAARPARPHGAGREGDHRADRETAALALDRRDRRAPGPGADRRARGARGQPQPPPALARPADQPRRLRGGAPRRTGSARRTRTSSWSRGGSPSTPRSPTSTSASGWSSACASSTT